MASHLVIYPFLLTSQNTNIKMNKLTIWETTNGNNVKALMGKDDRGFYEIKINDRDSEFFSDIKEARKRFCFLANISLHWIS
jgi:hypothetical protein